jgi:hypothetical protein
MSALGLKRTWRQVHTMSARTPESGHLQCTSPCPLCANSGHRGAVARLGSLNDYKEDRKPACDALEIAAHNVLRKHLLLGFCDGGLHADVTQ